MDRKYIIAPSHNIAKYYAGKNGLETKDLRILTTAHDANDLRGLRNIDVIILNHYECDDMLTNFAVALSSRSIIKLEFENV